jgi:Niemann-Pick C1 protein
MPEVPTKDHATRCSSFKWAGTGCQVHSEAIRPLAFEAVCEGICPGRILGNLRSVRDLHPTYRARPWCGDRVVLPKTRDLPHQLTDQKLALPSESYLVTYFENMEKYLDIGPPVYFVSRDTDVTVREGQQHLCGRFTTCEDTSVANILESERQQRRNSSFIAEPTASWIDDFLQWLDPSKESCCRVRKRNPAVFCRATDSERLCQPCFEGREPAWDITMNGLPEGEEFMKYLQQWLASPTTEECPLAGRASYGAALALKEDGSGVEASHFRTFHSPLRTQADFIHSMEAARRISEDLSEKTGTSIFPYSIHYVYFDQYLRIIGITKELLGLGLASVLLVTALLLGSWRTGLIVTGVVGLTIVSVMGVMGVWGINLNAVSLVNLVISLGIAVEFCAHVARAFMNVGSGLPIDHPSGQKERDERMGIALVDVGPSVSILVELAQPSP